MITVETYELIGRSPLLMSNTKAMFLPRGDVKKIPTPEEECKLAEYRSEDGTLYFPAIGIRCALLTGGKGKRIGKMGATTVLMAGAFHVEDECSLYDPDLGKPLKDYEISRMRCVVQKAGIIRARPKIKRWATKVVFEVDDDFVTAKQVEKFLNWGGRMAGIGGYRPERRGVYGRFRATWLKDLSMPYAEAA